MEGLHGTWFVVPTPFDPDGGLDLDSLRRLVDAAVGWGIDGLTVMGVMSEASALTPDERTAALRTMFDTVAGRAPVAVGCSSGSVRVTVALAEEATDLGAVAAMISAPPLLRDVDLLPEFYRRVCGGTGLPLVVQDEPAATGVAIPVSVLLRCLETSGTRTVKLEDPPTPPKIARLIQADPGLRVFGGLGGVSALGELRAGACGTMTGFAFPEILRAIREAHGAGDHAGAAALFDRYLPLIQFEGQPGIGLGIRKEVLRRRGVIATATTRALSPGPGPAAASVLDGILQRLGIVPSPGALRVT